MLDPDKVGDQEVIRRTCEEPADEKHGKVVGKEEEQPAGHKGRGESEHEPLLTDSWETNRWMQFSLLVKTRTDIIGFMRLLIGSV